MTENSKKIHKKAEYALYLSNTVIIKMDIVVVYEYYKVQKE